MGQSLAYPVDQFGGALFVMSCGISGTLFDTTLESISKRLEALVSDYERLYLRHTCIVASVDLSSEQFPPQLH